MLCDFVSRIHTYEGLVARWWALQRREGEFDRLRLVEGLDLPQACLLTYPDAWAGIFATTTDLRAILVCSAVAHGAYGMNSRSIAFPRSVTREQRTRVFHGRTNDWIHGKGGTLLVPELKVSYRRFPGPGGNLVLLGLSFLNKRWRKEIIPSLLVQIFCRWH